MGPLIAVHEVMQAQAEDPTHKVELLAAWRIRGAAAVAPERGVRHLRARAARGSDQPGHAAQLDRLAAETGQWPQAGHPVRDRAGQDRPSAQQIDLLLRLGRVYEEETNQPEEAIATYRKAVDAEAENKQALVALDRPLRPRAAVGRAGGHRAPGDRHRRLGRPAGRADLPAGADLRAGDDGLPKAVEAYREILLPRPLTPRRAPRSSGCLGGTMQIEIAEVLEPLYRAGEEWEKLHRSTRSSSVG